MSVDIDPGRTSRGPGRAWIALAAALAILAAITLAARLARADGLGAVHVHGMIDVTAATHDALPLNWDDAGTSAFDPYHAHLQAEDRVTPHWEVDGHVLWQEPHGPRLLGAYVQWTPAPARDLHLIAGKIPWLIGTYADRAYPDRNPLVGVPMLYQFHTGLAWYRLGVNPPGVPQGATYGDDYATSRLYASGMPVVWEAWWDVGAMAVGSARPFEGAFGVVQGTPGWAEPGEDKNSGKTVLGRVGLVPWPWLRVGASGALGPYLDDGVAAVLPPGKSVGDYDQQLAMADGEFALGHVELRGEGYRNVWQTPREGDLRVSGYYGEGKYTLPSGLYAAGRWEIQRYSRIDVAGQGVPWHTDQDRLEAGLGYRITRGVIAKAVYQRQRSLAAGTLAPAETHELGAAQLVVTF